MFGSNEQSIQNMAVIMKAESICVNPALNKHIRNMYEISYPFADNDVLIQVESKVDCMPHLMTWAPVTVPREGKLGLLTINRKLSKHLINLTDEEMALVIPRIGYISCFHDINAIDLYDECAIIHTQINGKAYSCVLTVMNLIKQDGFEADSWKTRESLN